MRGGYAGGKCSDCPARAGLRMYLVGLAQIAWGRASGNQRPERRHGLVMTAKTFVHGFLMTAKVCFTGLAAVLGPFVGGAAHLDDAPPDQEAGRGGAEAGDERNGDCRPGRDESGIFGQEPSAGAFRAISARSAVMASSWRRRSASRQVLSSSAAALRSCVRWSDERRISNRPRQIRKQVAPAPRPVTSTMATVAHAVMRAGFSITNLSQVRCCRLVRSRPRRRIGGWCSCCRVRD